MIVQRMYHRHMYEVLDHIVEQDVSVEIIDDEDDLHETSLLQLVDESIDPTLLVNQNVTPIKFPNQLLVDISISPSKFISNTYSVLENDDANDTKSSDNDDGDDTESSANDFDENDGIMFNDIDDDNVVENNDEISDGDDDFC